MTSLIEDIKMRGYDIPQVIEANDSLKEIYNSLESIAIPPDTLKPQSIRQIKLSSKLFLDSHLSLKLVPYEYYKKIGKLILSIKSEISPYNVPIKKDPNLSPFFGMLKTYVYTENNTRFHSRIVLPKYANDLTSIAYTHELIHSELNHRLYLIKEYYNNEMPSILMETIQAAEKDDGENLLRIHDYLRMDELKDIIKIITDNEGEDVEVLIDASNYIVSILKAYNLFIKYYYGDQYTKEYILYCIQELIDGTKCLEEILEELNITFSNSQDVQTLNKYLSR